MQKHKTAKTKSFTKRFNRFLSAMLIMMMIFTAIPIEPLIANAENQYAISIAGVRVTDANAADILGNGKFSYDNGTKTLTVSGDIARTGNNPSPAIDSSIEGLTINIAADSRLSTTGYQACISLNADTTITGTGLLTVEGKIRAINAQKLRVENATIHAKSTGLDRGSAAFGGPGSLEIFSSNIVAENGSELKQAAIADFNEGITLDNCEIITPDSAYIASGEIRDTDGNGAHEIKIGSGNYCTVPNSRILTSEEKVDADDKEIVKGGDLTFNAARNERESGQIVINKAGTYNNLSVTLDDLTLETNSAVKISASQIEYFFEQYVKIERQYYNLNGLADKGTTPVWYPDALINPDLAHTLGLDCFTLDHITPEGENKQNQGIWFTLNVPKDQKEGKYTGKFNVTFNDADGTPKSFIVPVKVRVYNFTLPTVTENKSKYGSSVYRVGCNKKTAAAEINDKIGIPINENEPALYNGGTSWYDGMQHEYQKIVSKFLNERKLSNGYTYGINYSETHFPKEVDELYDFVSSPDTKSPYYSISPNTSEAPVVKLPDKVLDTENKEQAVNNLIDYFEKEIIGEGLSDEEKDVIKESITHLTKDEFKSNLKNNTVMNVNTFCHITGEEKGSLTEDFNNLFKEKDVTSAIIRYYEKNAIEGKISDELKEKIINYGKMIAEANYFYYMISEEKVILPENALKTSQDGTDVSQNIINYLKDNVIKTDLSDGKKEIIINAVNGAEIIKQEELVEILKNNNDLDSRMLYYMLSDDCIKLTDEPFEAENMSYAILNFFEKKITECKLTDNQKNILIKSMNFSQNGIAERLKIKEAPESDFFYYMLYTQARINKPNFDKYLEVLIDKCISENFDMLKYATIRIPNIDEPDAKDFISCCRSLFNVKIVEDSKDHAKEYISNHANCSEELKPELLESVNNLHFIITKHPTQNGYYTDMLLNGLKSVIGTKQKERYGNKNSLYMADITLERYVQYLNKKGYTKNGEKYTVDTAEIREDWNFNKDNNTYYPTYSLTVPTDFSSGFFCPEFDVLSNQEQNYGEKTGAATTIKKCLNNGMPMWWYCTNVSGKYYTLPGNMIDCNRTANKKLNSLAVKRANQWQQYKMGIEGELYWGVDYYCINSTTPEGEKDRETYIFKNDIGINAKGYDWSASDGMMIYPVKQLYLNILKKKDENNKVSDADNVAANTIAQKYGYFTSSIRLENFAEGCDDYDYLCLANKLIKEAELINKDIDVTPYIERINKCYDTMFNGIDFDEKANSTNLSNARAKVADVICSLNYIVETGYSTLGTSSLGVSFYISPGDQKKMIFRFENEIDQTHHYSDPIYLDFENETASVGSIVKSRFGNSYEYIAFLDDLPMTNTPLSDTSSHKLYVKEYELKDNVLVAKNENDVNVSDFHRVELAKPVKQFGYEKTRFWNHGLNESLSNWKSSNKALKFEVKAVTVNDEKSKTSDTANIYFNHASNWGRTTNSIILDPVKGKLMKGEQEIGVVTELDYNWYRFEIPFSELDGDADKAIDMIEAEWIKHTFAVNNIEVVTVSEFPTEIRPVNRTVWGDANCNGGVDLSDAILIMQSIANPNKYGLGGTAKTAITEKGKELADVDTTVKGLTGNDAVMIQKYLLKLISSLDPSE